MDRFTSTIEGAAAYERLHAIPTADEFDEFGPDDMIPDPEPPRPTRILDFDAAKLASGEHPF